jgi:EAL domain-containing protein (putative c-di-GMP-specific phosphodiesterase class I)
VLHYQPRYSMATGKINGVEALLRWHHPTRGLVLPHDLLPLIRDAGLMIAVETWVLREACWQAIQWQRAGHAPIQVTVNLSIDPQTPGRIVQMVETVLDQTGLAPELLELDLSNIEAAKEPEAFVQALNQLKQLGVSLSLDDFGVGWSALSCLWRLPLDRIKIDRSVMPDIMNLPAAAVVVRGILNTITSLGLGCVAKGVETQDQVDFLRRETCAEFQGFLSGPAMPAAAVEVMLSESESGAASAQAK